MRTASCLALLLSSWAVPLVGQARAADIEVTPDRYTLRVGQRERPYLAAYDSANNLLARPRFTFVVSDRSVVGVESDGGLVGLAPGEARIEIRSGSASATVTVTVTPGESAVAVTASAAAEPTLLPATVLSDAVLVVRPTPLELLPLESRRLVAEVQRPDGSSLGSAPARWSALRPEIATVDSTGLVVALSEGTAAVQVSGPGGLAATVPVVVAAAPFRLAREQIVLGPGELDTLRAVVPTQRGRAIEAGLSWSSDRPDIVRVGPTGMVQGLMPGRATITARGMLQEHSMTVTVHRPIARVRMSPPPGRDPLRLTAHEEATIALELLAEDSSVVPVARMQWEVADTTVAVFDPASRILRGVRPGATSLTVRLTGFDPLHWTVEVEPARLGLAPARLGLTHGARGALAPRLLDGRGTDRGAVAGASFISDHPDIVRVDAAGRVEALAMGSATITATAPWGGVATATVYVTGEVLLASSRGGGMGLYQFAGDSSAAWHLLRGDGGVNLYPALSPDRTRIAFAAGRDGAATLWLMAADGSEARPLAGLPAGAVEPAWLPDGSGLIFSAGPGGATQLYSVAPDGSGLRQLTDDPGPHGTPTVSPDGRHVAYLGARDGAVDIYLLDLTTAEVRPLTRSSEREVGPRFLATGDLVYLAGAALVRQAAGTAVQDTLALLPLPVLSFGVSADGRRVAYVSGQTADPARGRNRGRIALWLQDLASGAPARELPLGPTEQVAHPSF